MFSDLTTARVFNCILFYVTPFFITIWYECSYIVHNIVHFLGSQRFSAYLNLLYKELNSHVQLCWFCMIVQNERQRDVFIIEAVVTTPEDRHVVKTSKVRCSGDALPSLAGTFTFLLRADMPGTFHINFRFKSLGQIGNCGFDEVLVDEIKTFVVTHYQNKNLSDYCDGHFVPAVEVPLAKKQLVGECFHK